MAMDLKKQVKILTVANIVLLMGVIYTVLLMLPYWFPEKDEFLLEGKIIYLSNISEPSNFSKGVWLKIKLDNPHKAELRKIVIGFKTSDGKDVYFNFNKNTTSKYGNYTAVFYDENYDGELSTGDLFHIYGGNLTDVTFFFNVSGYRGTIYREINALLFSDKVKNITSMQFCG